MDALFVPITFSEPPHSLLTHSTNAGAQLRVGPVSRFSLRSSVIQLKRFPIRCKKLSYSRFGRFRCAAEASNHRHGHHHGHHHHHHCGGDGDGVELTGAQKAFVRFAEAIRWTDLANYLREHLHLCCGSAALFITAAATPYLVPKPAVKPLQNVFIAVAFPLVGVRVVQTTHLLKHAYCGLTAINLIKCKSTMNFLSCSRMINDSW